MVDRSAAPPMQLAATAGAGFNSPGLSPRAIAQISGDDPYAPVVSLAAANEHPSALQLSGNGDAYGMLGFCDGTANPAAAWLAGTNGGDFDPGAMYAMQVATVPEPAAWLLAALAASAILLVLKRNRATAPVAPAAWK
jgi:hypothetical protein